MSPVETILKLFDTSSPTQQQCEDVVSIVARYPYFTTAAAVALNRCRSSIDALQVKQIMAQAALGASDRLAFYRLIEPSATAHSTFYPVEQTPKVTTESAIDTFLDTYGEPIPPEEQAMLEKLIFNPAADYSLVLKRELGDEQPKAVDRQDELLDAFLAKTTQTTGTDTGFPGKSIDHARGRLNDERTEADSTESRSSASSPSSSLLSESLARIYVKRGRYDKAYEIIHNLSLNFPEKSIYFADQLRFLQKLMVNSKYSNPQK